MSEKEKRPRLKTEEHDKEVSRIAKGDCFPSESTSHTQYFKTSVHGVEPARITTDEYCGVSESLSGSSSTFSCVKKSYTLKGLQKRYMVKTLDREPKVQECTKDLNLGWDVIDDLMFLVLDPSTHQQKERFISLVMDFVKTTNDGYRVNVLDKLCVLVDYLIEALPKNPDFREPLALLLTSMHPPLVLLAASDIVTYFDNIRDYLGLMVYFLLRLEDEDHFILVAKAIKWQLSAPDNIRPKQSPHRRVLLQAAAPVIIETVSRMIALAQKRKMPTFLNLALLLAWDSVDNCLNLMREHVIENVMYRFNPYFPHKDLPITEINPANVNDQNLKLGASHSNMQTTMSLLLVLLKTTMDYLDGHPEYKSLLLPAPDVYAQRCFVWVFRYECRMNHKHERNTLAVIAAMLLRCYGNRMTVLSMSFMSDVMSLSVLTEMPVRDGDWKRTVSMTTSYQDVHFKKMLIELSVHLLKVFPFNKCFVESCYWAQGLVYLIDPGLSGLRPRWSPELFAEIRKLILQTLVTIIPICNNSLVNNISITRRLMWYIEWYTENPYEISILYWCMRLLHVITINSEVRKSTVQDLFETHGIIVIIHLCDVIMGQKLPPVEKSQAVLTIAMNLLLSSARDESRTLFCNVYPHLRWPSSACMLARHMLDVAVYSLEMNFFIMDKWLIAILYFIWNAIIWDPKYKKDFIAKDGIYKLLDIISMSRPATQCLALAMISDATREGESVAQLVTWRAGPGAAYVHPILVKRGDTVAALLASIVRDECKAYGVRLDENGVILDIDCPIMSVDVRNILSDPEKKLPEYDIYRYAPVCAIAGEVAGSRMSKAFAILYMLSEDLHSKVSLADEAYKLYKNIDLAPEDETVLVLCSYYLTMKLHEVWKETQTYSHGYLEHDEEIIQEFLEIGNGWSKEIKRLQDDVIESSRNKERKSEMSLYDFLGRVRLNRALDALRVVRCTARSADRNRITQHSLLHDAVNAHHRRSVSTKRMGGRILRTYGPKLDEENVTGQNVKVTSVLQKDRPKPRDDYLPS